MSLVYGFEIESDVIRALPAMRSLVIEKRRGSAARLLAPLIFFARDFLDRLAAALDGEQSRFGSGLSLHRVMSDEEKGIRDDFRWIADDVGLLDAELAALLGATPQFSRVILALETLNAAVELFGAPKAALAWLRAENPDAPFNQRSPLRAMADEGRLGVEIALLHLRGRLRIAQLGDVKDARIAAACQA